MITTLLNPAPDMPRTDYPRPQWIMQGNKGRLFCLEISFFGWELLCVAPMLAYIPILLNVLSATGDPMQLLWILPLFLISFTGSLFVRAYQEAATAAFYREISEFLPTTKSTSPGEWPSPGA